MGLEVLLLEKILIERGFPIHHPVSVINTLSFVLRVKQGVLGNIILTTSVYIFYSTNGNFHLSIKNIFSVKFQIFFITFSQFYMHSTIDIKKHLVVFC